MLIEKKTEDSLNWKQLNPSSKVASMVETEPMSTKKDILFPRLQLRNKLEFLHHED